MSPTSAADQPPGSSDEPRGRTSSNTKVHMKPEHHTFRARTESQKRRNVQASTYPDQVDQDHLNTLELIDLLFWTHNFLEQEEVWFPASTSFYEPFYHDDDHPGKVSACLRPQFDIDLGVGRIVREDIKAALDRTCNAMRDAGIFFSTDVWRQFETMKLLPRRIRDLRIADAIDWHRKQDFGGPVSRAAMINLRHEKAVIENGFKAALNGIGVKKEARVIWDYGWQK